MQQLKSISQIDTNRIEGRLLMAALVKLSTESQTDKQPDEILQQCQTVSEGMYKDAADIPEPEVEESVPFEKALTNLINKRSVENGSDTPDFLLAEYLTNCLKSYETVVTARDKWFGVSMWSRKEPGMAKPD